jgi:RecG-like helicase
VVPDGAAALVDADAHLVGPDPDQLGTSSPEDLVEVPGRTAILDARWRNHVTVAGRVRSLRVAPLHDAPTLELVLVDDTGAISVVFLGRRALAGVSVGTRMVVEGTVGVHKARLAILNPTYHLLV